MEIYTFPAHFDAQNHQREKEREGERQGENITFSCTMKVEGLYSNDYTASSGMLNDFAMEPLHPKIPKVENYPE